MTRLRLPRPGHLPMTGPVDAIGRYHQRGIGWVLRRRLAWVQDALPPHGLGAVLEIGYGSGIFQYTLEPLGRLSVGIDLHPHGHEVAKKLAEDGIQSRLVQGDGQSLPFASGQFDAAVILSALEFIPSPGLCLEEALRVLKPRGRVVCLTPRPLLWADRLYKSLAGFDPEGEFKGGRARVQQALAALGTRARRLPRPSWLPSALAPYELVVLEQRR